MINIDTLEKIIEQWSKIENIHFEAYAAGVNIRRHDKLYAKAQMVVAALRHYKIELERT